MKTQKFVAPTMKDALTQVKEELGEDALIVRSERVKVGGPLNFMKQEMIEITAARPEEVQANAEGGPDFAETLDRSLSRPATPDMPQRREVNLSPLEDEVKRLREDLGDIVKYFRYNNLPNLPSELARIWESLGQSGVNTQWATDLTQEALINLGPEELISAQAVEDYLVDRLARVVRPAPAMAFKRRTAYKIAVVGAPGAGKTTLLQKLASDPSAYARRKVGLITLDTHRMAAMEQLRAFARIAGTPLEVVFQAEQCGTALSRLSSCEVILMDTAGHPPYESERMDALRGFMDRLDPDEIHLVLNATVRDEDLIYTARRFRDAGMTHLSFTRVDESLRHGCLLNVVRAVERPVAWLSKGQGFIGHLERFTPDHLRRWTVLSEPIEVREPSLQPDRVRTTQ
jgi:flagellar biosynthesis protein FlhF